VVALRSRALTRLSGTGGMASIALPADQVTALLAAFGALTVAACNGPGSTVVSGPRDELEQLVRRCGDAGTTARMIAVDYPSHGPLVEVLRDQLLSELAGLAPGAASTPLYSTLTGEPMDTTGMTAAYWYENLRQPVRFEDAVRGLLSAGHRSFIEASPHPVLAAPLEEILDGSGTVIGTLRRDEGGRRRFLASAARAHVAGVTVAWDSAFAGTGPHRVPLPTYPFQHQPYWLRRKESRGGATPGLAATLHPLIGAVTTLPDGGWLLTGQVSIEDHPWTADHAVHGTPLLPATAFLDMALEAAAQSGCDQVTELIIEAPLAIPDEGKVTLQVMVSAGDEAGTRSLTVHSRVDQADADGAWTLHVTGVLGAAAAPAQAGPPVVVPPGAKPLDLTSFYDRMREIGLDYGPGFQGLTSAWRDGATVYGEVVLAEGTDSAGYPLHPALLDAGFQLATFALDPAGQAGQALLPFSVSGAAVTAGDFRRLLVQVEPTGPATVKISLADADGVHAGQVSALTVRPVSAGALATIRATGRQRLFQVAWRPAATGAGGNAGPWTVAGDPRLTEAIQRNRGVAFDVAGCPCPPGGQDAASEARAWLDEALTTIQAFIGEPHDSAGARLVLVTRHAVATEPGAPVNPAAAAVWGLVRSAQSENPGRLVLLDIDDSADSYQAAAQALTGEADQLAVRAGAVTIPRLARTDDPDGTPLELTPEGTVLVTGATGTLGSLLARHLAQSYGARRLLLVSRQGASASGADALRADLEALGAEVTIAACDVADREELRALLATVPARHPLTAVFHAAGVLKDATIPSLLPEHLDTVLRPKADAAWSLHELTSELPLRAFVLYSSAAGILGAPGQAGYSAANSFLDALAEYRHALGLPAVSLAWGVWEDRSGMTADASLAQLRRNGLLALPARQALELLDTALASRFPAVVAARLNWPALRQRGADGTLPAILSGLVTATSRRPGPARLPAQLAAAEPGQRPPLLLDAVRSLMAAVLGHSSAEAIRPDRPFQELGFDSLTAIEFRNQLADATGLRLAASLIFDYPTAEAVAGHLLARLIPAEPAPADAALAELDRLESAIARMPAGDPGRAQVTARLQRMLAAHGDGRPAGGTAVADRIETASLDEVFSFIDTELGRPAT
jgi:acyl transferase domain-containing protein/acyl carrier protein